MTVFKKLVLFTEQVEDKTLEQIAESCVSCFGQYLGSNYESQEDEDGWNSKEENLAEYTRKYDGNVITINTNCISYEWELPLFQYDFNIQVLVDEFLENQTIIEVPDEDDPKYSSCITKTEKMLKSILQQGNATTLYIKIFKIGNLDYYCFSV